MNAWRQARFGSVSCLSPAGFHRMSYTEWGDPDCPDVLLCVHGLTRVGRDFDRLAAALIDRYRVVCPDVVGRGASDWLRDPRHYQLTQYAADMVALIARLNVAQVDWLGTSMGGLIGLVLAAQADSPIRKFVINDVGPTLDAAALRRIGEYVGKPVRFATMEQAVTYISLISASFGLKTQEEWREITETVLRRDGDAWVLHYDPLIGEAFRMITTEAATQGEATAWSLWERIHCPTLLIHGVQSDLLTLDTARQMIERQPQAKMVEFAGVGHAPMFMHDDQIGVVRNFLVNG